jgi:hypothetical protein
MESEKAVGEPLFVIDEDENLGLMRIIFTLHSAVPSIPPYEFTLFAPGR